jgi:hypothetical protein
MFSEVSVPVVGSYLSHDQAEVKDVEGVLDSAFLTENLLNQRQREFNG